MSEAKSPVDAWIDNSARHHAEEERYLMRRCENAFTKEPYRSAALLLADAHRECARVWERVLARAVKP